MPNYRDGHRTPEEKLQRMQWLGVWLSYRPKSERESYWQGVLHNLETDLEAEMKRHADAVENFHRAIAVAKTYIALEAGG